jgi:hypothetical protein
VKYGVRDHRGGVRSSARETAVRVCAGAMAKLALKQLGITVQAYTSQVGGIRLDKEYWQYDISSAENNVVRCPDVEKAKDMEQLILDVKRQGNTVGGIVTCVVKGAPVGLGEPLYGKLTSVLAHAMFSINAVKGFEYGNGFAAASGMGSEQNDIFYNNKGKVATRTNNSGGIQGGISNGNDIYFNVAFKPVATLLMEMDATWKLRNEEFNYYAKKLRLRTMEATVADDNIELTLWDDKKLAKKVEEYIAKGYSINQVIEQVLRPYKTAIKKYFSIATEQSIMTENDTLSDSGGYSNKKYWVENYLRPHLKEAGMLDVDVSVVKHTIVLTKQGYSCCIEKSTIGPGRIFSPNACFDNFKSDIPASTPVSVVVKYLRHMPTVNRRVDENIVKALHIYDKLMCQQNEEYNKIVEHLAALSAQHAGKPVGKFMKYLRWSVGNLLNKLNAGSRMDFHTIAVTGDTSFNFTAREMKSIVPLIYGDEFIKEKWIDAECSNVYSDNPEITDEQGWIKANRSRWNWKLREFAGHSCWDTFLTVDFINEKL